jgi:hypothetical protein
MGLLSMGVICTPCTFKIWSLLRCTRSLYSSFLGHFARCNTRHSVLPIALPEPMLNNAGRKFLRHAL